jgi:hypothetical protein
VVSLYGLRACPIVRLYWAVLPGLVGFCATFTSECDHYFCSPPNVYQMCYSEQKRDSPLNAVVATRPATSTRSLRWMVHWLVERGVRGNCTRRFGLASCKESCKESWCRCIGPWGLIHGVVATLQYVVREEDLQSPTTSSWDFFRNLQIGFWIFDTTDRMAFVWLVVQLGFFNHSRDLWPLANH